MSRLDREPDNRKIASFIQIDNLTPRQVVLCDIMWDLDTHENVEAFIATLPRKDARDCRTLIEMMRLSFADQITSTDVATKLLKDIFK